eukprot:COSAG02_NODE_1400_length_12844_cov_5.256493_5_plen_53_part_00
MLLRNSADHLELCCFGGSFMKLLVFPDKPYRILLAYLTAPPTVVLVIIPHIL